MKRFWTLVLVLVCVGSIEGGAHAASMSPDSATARFRPWLGSWECKAGDDSRTMTFTPILNGTAMRVTESGKLPIEEIVRFDSKRNKWINQHAGASGAYATFEGTQGKNKIVFSQVYPAAPGPVLTVTMPSNNRFTTSFSAMMSGKRMTETELCTKK